jgi:hypothetical protein
MNISVKEYNRTEVFKAWIPSIIILPLAVYFTINWGNFTLMDYASLVIHEAGHFFFILFGKFIYTLGGTLMQIMLPLFVAWYFFYNSYRTGVQFSFLWLGQNLLNISVYASDARERALPLLGGNKVYHDWHYMLSELNILKFDTEIGYFFLGLAVLFFIVALLLPLINLD